MEEIFFLQVRGELQILWNKVRITEEGKITYSWNKTKNMKINTKQLLKAADGYV